jgi:hypothetical protein
MQQDSAVEVSNAPCSVLHQPYYQPKTISVCIRCIIVRKVQGKVESPSAPHVRVVAPAEISELQQSLPLGVGLQLRRPDGPQVVVDDTVAQQRLRHICRGVARQMHCNSTAEDMCAYA